MPTEEQLATCRNCGHTIIWYFDRDDDAQIIEPHGFWYDVERMTEACGGPDPDVTVDEDLWHEPEENSEEPHCAHGVPLVSKVEGPNNYCPECERAGVAFIMARPE